MGVTHSLKAIRFHINSQVVPGSFTLKFEPYIIYKIEEAIDNYIFTKGHKMKKNNMYIGKYNGVYEINLKGFICICHIIFQELKKCS